MSDSRAQAAYHDSEAALRLVDKELDQLREGAEAAQRFVSVSLADLPHILERANSQIRAVLLHLRETRQAIQSTTIGKLQTTHDKIKEVTSATEDAAINIMDACDRANQIDDELDGIDASETPDRQRATDLRATLRDELFMMMGALQFQDITSQQLAHASAVLVEMESRLADVATLFDSSFSVDRPLAAVHGVPDEKTYDPNATIKNAEQRQNLADEIFTAVKVSAA
jgi:chemotaxis regulatin CheY-phosphate phosphatase CheZ